MKNIKKVQLKLSLLVIVLTLLMPSITVFGAKNEIRTIGYLPDYDYGYASTTVNYDQLTDLNYFALIPQTDGKLKFTDSGSGPLLKELVETAHEANVRVGISIGGWGMSDNFAEATSSKNLDKFVKNIVEFVKEYNLDTVDIDWEYPEVKEAKQFTSFILALREALKPAGTELSICVPTGVASNGKETGKWGKHFPPEALRAADWINIMSYDAQVEESPEHSPIELQKNSLNYWNEVMGGDQMDKLAGGIPFYGKAVNGAVMTYRRIMEEYGRVLVTDHAEFNGHEYYFNNKETVQKKVEDTIELGAMGVMIWAPSQDTKLDSSSRLMDVVVKTIKNNDLVLNKTIFNSEGEKIQREVPWGFFLLIISFSLIGLATLFMLGYLRQLLPDILFGKQVNPAGLGRLLGLFIGLLGVLVALSIFIPFYIIVGFLVVVLLGLYLILK